MMLNFSNARISQFIVHFVGNKNDEIGYKLSNNKLKQFDRETEALLVNYFLSPFKNAETFKFWHESDINLNTAFSFVSEMFINQKKFVEKSKFLAKHLYECSTHPNIKSGDLFIAELSDCIYGESVVNAVIIYKSENKEDFLQCILSEESDFELKRLTGTSLNRIDKAAVVFNNSNNDGFRVCIIDNANRTNEAAYWKDDFLKINSCEDEYYNTNQFLSITKKFVSNQLDQEFEISRPDRIDLLNRSVDYFKTHENFNKKEFENVVFQDAGIIKSFRKFEDNYQQENEIDLSDNFEISKQAVKKQARAFKSVLKLDKNFHVYIHGDRELIEQGVEKDGRKYYKIYYNNET